MRVKVQVSATPHPLSRPPACDQMQWLCWGGEGGYLVLGNGLHVLANGLQDCIHSLIRLLLLWGGEVRLGHSIILDLLG